VARSVAVGAAVGVGLAVGRGVGVGGTAGTRGTRSTRSMRCVIPTALVRRSVTLVAPRGTRSSPASYTGRRCRRACRASLTCQAA